MATQLPPELEAWITARWLRFPAGAAGSALVPEALHRARAAFGQVDAEVVDLIAERLQVNPARVRGTASLDARLRSPAVGRYHLQVCTDLCCMLNGADEVFARCKARLGVGDGETSADGAVTLSSVECLTACGVGPVAQVAEAACFIEHLDSAKADRVLDALVDGRLPSELRS